MAEAIPALFILSAGNVVFLSHRISWDLLFGLGHQRKLVLFEAIEAVTVCGLSFFLSQSMGITGVAVAIVLPIVFVRGLFQAKYVCSLLKIGLMNYYASCLLKPWIIGVLIGATFRWFDLGSSLAGWLPLIAASVALLGIYLVAVFGAFLTVQERQHLWDSALDITGKAGT